ncbi:MAG: Fis family transcriptional regulator [Candidatus Omnitrophota bacterium]|nr:Fis family transcriptional regulator [Candidatus Omnitrophota bacterium]MDZ4242541.1 Fis family transcriptional regulator [Candidatus Omnitrophota bacterium]
MKNKHIGSKFDDFLKEENLLEEAQAAAIKRVIAFQIQKIMEQQHITKSEMTARMQIKSRTQLDRLLDPENVSVTLLTLEKAANALGKKLKIQLA